MSKTIDALQLPCFIREFSPCVNILQREKYLQAPAKIAANLANRTLEAKLFTAIARFPTFFVDKIVGKAVDIDQCD